MAFDSEGFNRQIALPPELKVSHIRKAVEYIEREATDLVEVYFEQANVFSGLVGIFGVRALHSLSPYKKHKHPDVAQQRFPDLSLGGKLNPPPKQALESKGTTRPWALQSHYNHPGWYIVWRYLVDPAKIIKAGKSVVIWRVDVAFLRQEDWKYEGSKAAEGRGGRTHTFGVKQPADRFSSAIAYCHPKIVLRQSRPTLANGVA
ncbi:MAG: hypothetical protein HY508_02265 [Acidobacteria bacterium]|nr:hypothetical protein [Acidobacteriota bacterium]